MSVDRGDGAVRMQRGEHEVTRLADGERGLHRLDVAHFSDEHDVRVLAEDVLEGALERGRVGADLALVHHAQLVRVQVLDRVLDRHDVAALLAVDLVDHRRERGALAAAGGAGHEDEAVGLGAQLRADGREAELVEAQDLERDGAERAGHSAALHVDVGAEAREVLHAEREIELVRLFEVDLLVLGEDRVAELLAVDRAERRELQRDDVPVDAKERRRPRGDVHVARTLLNHGLEKLVEVDLKAGGLGHELCSSSLSPTS